MRTLQRLMLVAPLVLMASFATAKEKTHAPKEIPQADAIPAGQRCYIKCMDPMQSCTKTCGKNQRCITECANELKRCTDGCGGPPAPPK